MPSSSERKCKGKRDLASSDTRTMKQYGCYSINTRAIAIGGAVGRVISKKLMILCNKLMVLCNKLAVLCNEEQSDV
jgi:hypothetical protein